MSATTLAGPHPQHLAALARANKVRLARAELKRRIADGVVTAAQVIAECPWEAESMTVADVLQSQRRWGAMRCRRFLLGFHVSETKTVGKLTDRQRAQLASALGS